MYKNFTRYSIHDLAESQRQSFLWFIFAGLPAELNRISPLKLGLNQFRFHTNTCRIRTPRQTAYQTLIQNKTYSGSLYIAVSIYDPIHKKVSYNWVYLGPVHLLLPPGCFIINGLVRTIVHQIIGAAGPYCFSAEDTQRKNLQFDTEFDLSPKQIRLKPIEMLIINERRQKLKLGFLLPRTNNLKQDDHKFYGELKSQLWFFWGPGRFKEIQMRYFLAIIGSPSSILNDNLKFYNQTSGSSNTNVVTTNLNYFYKIFTPTLNWRYAELEIIKHWGIVGKKTYIKSLTIRRYLYQLFYATTGPSLGQVGSVGRMRLNRRFDLIVDETEHYITPNDLITISRELELSIFGFSSIDDRDHFKNRRVRSCGEFLQFCWRLGLSKGLIKIKTDSPDTDIVQQQNLNVKALRLLLRNQNLILNKTDLHESITTITLNVLCLLTFQVTTNYKSILGSSICSISNEEYTIKNWYSASIFWSISFYKLFYICEKLNLQIFNLFMNGPISDIFFGSEKKITKTTKLLLTKAAIWPSYNMRRLDNTIRPIIEKELKMFFSSNPMSQYTQKTNPLESLSHSRRCSALGPGGLNKDFASIAVRNIHPSHFGRICPIETPEGKNVGIVNSPSLGSRLNMYGFFEVPFRKIVNGVIEEKHLTNYASPSQEVNTWIAGNENLVSLTGTLSSRRFRTRNKDRFSFMTPKGVSYIGVVPPQMISVGAALIPFVEHNDGNRALMGSNMQRQALPIINPERPIVGTGLEPLVVTDSRGSIRAIASGYVYAISGDLVKVHSLIHWKDNIFRTIEYCLGRYQATQKGTFFDQRPWVNIGDWIQLGDLIADSSAGHMGDLALGRNLLVAYTPWDGYNYEDAVVVSERIVKEDLLTSIHIKSYSVDFPVKGGEISKKQDNKFDSLPESLSGHYELVLGLMPGTILEKRGVPKNQRRALDTDGVIRLGAWVEPNDILVSIVGLKQEQKPSTGVMRLVNAILGKQVKRYQDYSFYVPPYVSGRVIDCQGKRPNWTSLLANSSTKGNRIQELNGSITIYIAQRRRLKIGDKIAGRHGNKGVVAKILPQHEMPYSISGLTADVVLNPLGVPSRMNVGQIYEGLLGLAGRFLGQNYRILPFDEVFGPEASYGLVNSKLLECRRRIGMNWIFNPQQPGKTPLFDGRTGEPLEQCAMLSLSYILKLEHQVDEKIHSRRTGPYSLVTQQPVRGRSRLGGQRLGEMEVWALEGFGASYILYEMLTTKSDHLMARRLLASELSKGIYALPPNRPKIQGLSEGFLLLKKELQALCIDIQFLIT